MKKNCNIIQIKGIRGLIIIGLIACCLFAGFIVFPGHVLMYIWNYLAKYTTQIPGINIIQGTLLWGIIIVSYFTFRKEKLVVCVKSPQGLNEEELKAVFADIKKQANEDKIIQTMLKARETELKIKEEKEKSENINTK